MTENPSADSSSTISLTQIVAETATESSSLEFTSERESLTSTFSPSAIGRQSTRSVGSAESLDGTSTFLKLPSSAQMSPPIVPSNSSSPTLLKSVPSFAPNSIVNTLESDCETCDFSSSQILETGFVSLNSSSQDVVGLLLIPRSMTNLPNTVLSVTAVSNVPQDFFRQTLGGIILDIVLRDSSNNLITSLEAPLTICFSPPSTGKSNGGYCLSYYDESKSKWQCEDECLLQTDKGQLCGKTDHLTNFALLLTGKTGGSGGNGGGSVCQSSSVETAFAWVSLGIVAGAILLVGISVIGTEIYFRHQTIKQARLLREIAAHSQQL